MLNCLNKICISFLCAFVKLRNANNTFIISVCLSVRMEQSSSHWTNFHEILYLSIFRKSVEKIRLLLQYDKNNRYEELCTFTISHSFLLRMRNFSDKFVEKIKRHILCTIVFFPPKKSWKYMVQPDWSQMTIQYGTCALRIR
jgi:hypothetical protein